MGNKAKRSKVKTPPDAAVKPAFRNPFISPEGKPAPVAKPPEASKPPVDALSPSTPSIGSPSGSPEDKASKPPVHADDAKTPPAATALHGDLADDGSSPVYDTDSPGSELRSPAQKAMDRSALRSNPMFVGGDDADDSIDADTLPMELSPEPPTPAPRVVRAGSHPPLKTAAQNGGIVTKTCFLCGEECGDGEAPRQKDRAGRYSHVACVRLMRRAADACAAASKTEEGPADLPVEGSSAGGGGGASMEGVASSASLMGELRAALVETQGFASAVDAAGAFLFDTPSSSPSKTSTYSRDAQGVQTGAQTVGTGRHPGGHPGTPVVDVAFLDAVRGPPPRRTHRSSTSRPETYRRLSLADMAGSGSCASSASARRSPGVAMRSSGPTGYSLPGTPRKDESDESIENGDCTNGRGSTNANANNADANNSASANALTLDASASYVDAFKRAALGRDSEPALKEKVAACARSLFRLRDSSEPLLGVYGCCKGENPLESGEMFVFARHVCFRRTKTALFDPAESQTPTKFAVPAAAVVDATPNPSVYPFGAILLSIDGVGDPWLFSFFTERSSAIETINSMLDAAIDPVRRSAMRAKHAEERERRETFNRECPRDDKSHGSIESLAEFDKENAPPRNGATKTAAEIISESVLEAAAVKAAKDAGAHSGADAGAHSDAAPSPTRSVLDLNESTDPRDKWHCTRTSAVKRILYSVVGVAALAFGGVGEAVTRAREAHALAKRRDDRFPRRRRKSADKGAHSSGGVKGTYREAGKAKKAVAPARKQNGLKPKRGWEPIRL